MTRPTARSGRRVLSPKTGGERETSIRRGVEVLLSLAEEEAVAGGGLGVTRIAELLGREKSQVSRSLKALNEYGLVQAQAYSSTASAGGSTPSPSSPGSAGCSRRRRR